MEAKEEEEAALQKMIQAEAEHCESQERALIEEYARENAEAMKREKAEGINRVRAEAEAKARAEDDMRKQVWRAKSLGLRNSKNSRDEGGQARDEKRGQ